ncbi:uncharacterized protein MYCFIDRAFT_86443 [Pseudocercospora fijiensis CIRAD86]|uniref:DUF1993 domain-containing protein n=1 Tax=Pseudocercospora fijiensis (strain CIRAD86) TaxID=383855 RepID=M2YTF6_PSEFD|nr:uncharacterized protein MYCFIDRAFT_86443 [Pseudocercospora fijiensis CIRAD86]EME81040.1 hypothetical protein MYCFIDRAFT_86443 [Pseudocercospora fijiensis CIRAD86]
MSLTLYDLSVPILVRSLENLKGVLQKGEQWAKDNGKSESELLEARIVDDMKPLTFQIQTCSDTAKGILFRIGGEENTPMEDNEKSLADLYARIDATVKILRAAKKEKFSAPDTKCVVKMGPHEAEFTGIGYLQKFVIPNFFFHYATAYDILRSKGVPVGKSDYLGGKDLTTWEL